MSQPSPQPGDPVAPGPSDPVPVDLRDYVDFDLDEASGRRVFTTDVLAVDLWARRAARERLEKERPAAAGRPLATPPPGGPA